MKINIVEKKMEKIKFLLHVHAKTKAALTYMEKDAVDNEVIQGYKENLINTLNSVEKQFDSLLK